MTYKNELEQLKKLTRFYKALAHPARLFIIQKLLEKELCVNELTEMVGVEMPTISSHLAILKNAGILISDKRGKRVFYKIKHTCIKNVFECSTSFK